MSMSMKLVQTNKRLNRLFSPKRRRKALYTLDACIIAFDGKREVAMSECRNMIDFEALAQIYPRKIG